MQDARLRPEFGTGSGRTGSGESVEEERMALRVQDPLQSGLLGLDNARRGPLSKVQCRDLPLHHPGSFLRSGDRCALYRHLDERIEIFSVLRDSKEKDARRGNRCGWTRGAGWIVHGAEMES